MALQRQLNRCLDRLSVVTHLDEHGVQAHPLLARVFLSSSALPNKREQLERVLDILFGEANMRGDSRVYSFIEGQSIYSLDFGPNWLNGNAIIFAGSSEPARERFASWLRRRCEQQIAIEENGNTMDVPSGVTIDV
jgi:hypothetical protein